MISFPSFFSYFCFSFYVRELISNHLFSFYCFFSPLKEVQQLTSSLSQLKTAFLRFQESRDNLETMTKASSFSSETNAMFIPLTNSLYVEGTWNDNNQVLIDIGTGYYIKQPINDAQEFFKRKMTYVKQAMDQVQKSLIEKRNQLDYLVETLQTKLILQQRQSGGASTS